VSERVSVDQSMPAATPAGPAGPSLGQRVLASDAWMLLLSVAYFLVVLPFAPDLANAENFALVLSSMLPLFAVTVGQTFVLITGGIDLSVTSIVALASVTGAWVMTSWGLSPVVAMLAGVVAMVVVGAGLGLVNGLAITRLAMPPFMVTLATMMFGSGFALWATRSNAIPGLPEGFNAFAQDGLGFVPQALMLIAPLGVLAHVVLARTMYGQRLIAVGMNARAARVSGVPVSRTVLAAYVVCGIGAAIGAILYTGRLETGSPVMGQRIFLDVIGAAVLGGTSLFGGKGSVVGTLYGVLLITLIDNSLNLLGFSSFTVLMAKGTVILLAALLDAVRSRRLGRAT
jgi:ribose transport system permease protein